ncbi:ABC transporter permease [Campylobacterota bacterium]|nr:ABC transporter permease [Campylobacterota bacterium]
MSAAVLGNDTPWSEVHTLLIPAYLETLTMVGVVMVLVVLIGGASGVLLFNTSEFGLFPHRRLNRALGWTANMGRSLPFLVLMAAIIPFTKYITGTTIGIKAAIVPMVIAGTPFFARLVENALRDLPREVNSVGLVSCGSPWQIIIHAQLSEALPGIVAGITLNTISMIEYSAIAGTIGAGGIGYLAVLYGYQRFDHNIMISTIIVLIATIQLIQFIGDRVTRRLIK